jgi:hypothetical protein
MICIDVMQEFKSKGYGAALGARRAFLPGHIDSQQNNREHLAY